VTGPGSLPMTEGDLSALLVASMLGDAETACTDPTCRGCQYFRRVWWDTYNRLTLVTTEKIAIVSMLNEVPFPPSPLQEWEL
jgi:hypothetical protein